MSGASQTRTPETQLFRDVFNASPIGIVVENLEGQPLFINPAFCSMLGFSEEELRSKHCVQFSPREDAEVDWALFQQLRAGSIDHYQLEKRYFRRDGSLLWGRLSISLLKSRPSPLVIAMVEEITDKKMAEEAVRDSEERLRLAQQVARIGSFERNVRTGIVTWSTDLESIYGLKPGSFQGTTTAFFQDLIHLDDQSRVTELVDCALKTREPMTGEWRVLWPDGSIHWIAGSWQVFSDESGEPSRILGMNMDITERKRTEETLLNVNRTLSAKTALLQSREELLKIFVKHVPVAVAMLDCNMRYVQVSDRWCADFCLETSNMLGRSHYEMFPDIPDRWRDVHRRALAGETFRVAEDRWDRKNGTVWLRWEIRPWQNLDGEPGGVLIFSEDITDRKRAEQELLGMSGRLIEAHEQERTRIGRDLHDDVVQRMALVAMELDAIQRDVPDSFAKLGKRMGNLRHRIEEIANDVQLLSHELHLSKLDYLGIVGAARNFCRDFSKRQKVKIDFQSDDVPTALPTEISLCLFRVLQEALRNATKHSGAKRFQVRLWGVMGEVHLAISDLGVGFDPRTVSRTSGLGLTSMQERLRLVNGELSINSQRKGGTTVHARVPLSPISDSTRAVGYP